MVEKRVCKALGGRRWWFSLWCGSECHHFCFGGTWDKAAEGSSKPLKQWYRACGGRHLGWRSCTAWLTFLKAGKKIGPDSRLNERISEQGVSRVFLLINVSPREVNEAGEFFCPLVLDQSFGTVLFWCRGVHQYATLSAVCCNYFVSVILIHWPCACIERVKKVVFAACKELWSLARCPAGDQ